MEFRSATPKIIATTATLMPTMISTLRFVCDGFALVCLTNATSLKCDLISAVLGEPRRENVFRKEMTPYDSSS